MYFLSVVLEQQRAFLPNLYKTFQDWFSSNADDQRFVREIHSLLLKVLWSATMFLRISYSYFRPAIFFSFNTPDIRFFNSNIVEKV